MEECRSRCRDGGGRGGRNGGLGGKCGIGNVASKYLRVGA